MRPPSLAALNGISALILVIAATRSGAAAREGAGSGSRDALLQRKVSVTANGIPLRYLVKRLETVAGVPLSVSGRAGDERAIVLVRDAPIHEVMSSLAELYRLQWTRSAAGETWKYVLGKPEPASREEAALRERTFRAAYGEWMKRETEALDPAAAERALVFRPAGRPPVVFDAGIKECQARLLPLARPELSRLLGEGVLTQPLALLPAAGRAEAIAAVRTWLNNQDAALHRLYRAAVEEGDGNGPDAPVRARRVSTAARAEEASLRIQLDTRPQLSLSAAVLTPDGQSHALDYKHAFIPMDAGVDLYAGRAIRPARGGDVPVVKLADADPLSRPLAAVGAEPQSGVTLVERLQQIASASGLSIYADDTSGTWLLGNRRPAEDYPGTGGAQAAEALDALCRQEAPGNTAHSFWWRKGAALFLRSRNWLWEAEAVLPADLPQSLAASIRRTERPGAPNLNRLALLSGLQVASLQSRPAALPAWKYFVQAPNALSLSSRLRLAQGGLSWEQLSEAERAALFRIVPSVQKQPVTYSVRLESWLQRGDGGHETAVLTLDGRCGGEKISTGLRIPVPDLRGGLTVTLR